MPVRPLRRPSPALVVACVALLVALTGTSYATVLNVPRASVGTPQMKRNAVKARQLAPNAVRTAHVLNGSLLAADFKAGQLPAGPKGDKGDPGAVGPKGAGVENATWILSQTAIAADGAVHVFLANCPAGRRAFAGGFLVGADVTVRTSSPNSLPVATAWRVDARNTGAVQRNVNVYALCVPVS